jgi:hypothetical protein
LQTDTDVSEEHAASTVYGLYADTDLSKETDASILGRGNTKETGNPNATAISENCYQPEFEHVLLNGAAQIEETATQFPQFALFHSVTCVQHRLITSRLLNLRCSIQ